MRIPMDLTLGLICVIFVALACLLAKCWRRSGFPGPVGLPFFGISLGLIGITSKDIIYIFKNWYKKYGDIFEYQILGRRYVVLSDPELVKPILCSSANITKGGYEYTFMRSIFNDGLLVSHGDKWRMRRKLLTPSFHYKILETSIETVSRNAEEYVSYLLASGGKPTEMEDSINLLTLKIICVAMTVWCTDFSGFGYIPTLFIAFLKLVIRNRKELFIAEKNGYKNKDTTKKERNAFLDNLLDLGYSNPGLFTDADIEEEVNTFMIAGHNPSGAILKFLHFILANHPDVQEKAYLEQMSIFEDNRIPTIQDLQKMTYLEMVIKEALRLYPSLPFHSRILSEDLQLDENTVIPAGQTIVVFTYAIHRSEKHWKDPEEFIPERFAPGNERHPFSFIPFSAGPRNCIGQKYAMVEIKTIMSTVLRHCWLEPVTTSVTLDYSIVLQSADPIMVKVFPRKGSRRVFENEDN